MPDTRLKKIDELTFQEISEKKDDQGLKWKRGLNHLFLKSKTIEVIHEYMVNDEDHLYDDVNTETKENLSIQATLDQEQLDDTIYFLVPEEKGSDIYRFECPKGQIRVLIKSGERINHEASKLKGVYFGNIVRNNLKPNEDDISFSLAMPRHNLEKLISKLSNIRSPEIELFIKFRSFTNELDDAFREWYHPRQILIGKDVDIALLERARVYESWENPDDYTTEREVDDPDLETESYDNITTAFLEQIIKAAKGH